MRIIWAIRTMSMFTLLTLLLVGIGALVSMLTTGNWYLGMGIMIVVSLVFVFVSYWWSKEMALASARAKIIDEYECPRLFNIVREVSQKAGLPMPEVGISPDPAPNAFATGRNPKNAAVVCTQGILSMLPDDELRGVIAHEMSHIKNRDILVMSITTALASIVSYMARMLMWMAIFAPAGGRNDNSRLALIAVAIAAQILVPLAAILVQLGISRNREYLADETGAKMINDPRALARALDHLEKGNQYVNAHRQESRSGKRSRNPADDYECAHMWIANPLKEGSITAKLFSTHPPMQDRIRRLNEMADKMGL